MAIKLTKKERAFVKGYLETGNGTKAALAAYNTDKESTAAAIASENLRKPKIESVIEAALSDDLLAQRHLELLNKREIIRTKDGAELSDQPDTQAVKAALDMAYKLKGSYAPEKSVVANIHVNHEHRERATAAIRGITR